MNGHLFALMMVGVHENPLDQVVAVLVARNVNERDAWTIRVSSGDNPKITIQKFRTSNLEAFFNNFGSKLVNAVVVGVGQDVVNDTALVWRGAVLAQMLNAPVAELSMGNEVNVGDDFFDGRAFFLFDTILENVLDDEAAGFT